MLNKREASSKFGIFQVNVCFMCSKEHFYVSSKKIFFSFFLIWPKRNRSDVSLFNALMAWSLR